MFHQIIYVVVADEDIKLVTEEWETVKYDRHTHTYAIQQLRDAPWSINSIGSLYDNGHTFHAIKAYKENDQHSYIVLRHKIY